MIQACIEAKSKEKAKSKEIFKQSNHIKDIKDMKHFIETNHKNWDYIEIKRLIEK